MAVRADGSSAGPSWAVGAKGGRAAAEPCSVASCVWLHVLFKNWTFTVWVKVLHPRSFRHGAPPGSGEAAWLGPRGSVRGGLAGVWPAQRDKRLL